MKKPKKKPSINPIIYIFLSYFGTQVEVNMAYMFGKMTFVFPNKKN